MRPTKEARLPQLRVEGTLKRTLDRMAHRERTTVADLQREALGLLIAKRCGQRRAALDELARHGGVSNLAEMGRRLGVEPIGAESAEKVEVARE